MKIIEKNYLNTVSKGRMSESDFKNKMSLIKGATNLESISNVDVIVEAVFEEMSLKKEMFERIDKIAKKNCNPRPHIIVISLIPFLLFDNKNAIPNITKTPTNPDKFVIWCNLVAENNYGIELHIYLFPQL